MTTERQRAEAPAGHGFSVRAREWVRGSGRTAVLVLGVALALESGAAKSQGAEPADPMAEVERLKAENTELLSRLDDLLILSIEAIGKKLELEAEIERLHAENIELNKLLGTAVGMHPDNAPWASDDDDVERFQLWAGCEPMWLNIVVDDTTEDGPKLTEESVRSAVESRLRSARLYSDERTGVQLGVTADRFGNPTSFQLSVKLWKIVLDINTGLRYASSTWGTRAYGRGPSEYVRTALSEHIDRFLIAYLRVNEAECGSANAAE